MDKDLLGQAFKDPIVLEGFERGHSIDRVPIQALVDKVEEFCVLALLKYVVKRFSIRQSASAARIRHNNGHEGVFLEEKVATRAQLDDVVWRHALNLHDVGELFGLVFTWEERVARVQLCHDASEGPHINRGCVRNA